MAIGDYFHEHPDEYRESRRGAGVVLERAYLQKTPMGSFVVAYIESTRTLRRTTAKWDHAMASIRDRVSADIEDHGSFRVTVAPGVFVCKPRRRPA